MASTLLFMVVFAIDFIAFALALAAEQKRRAASILLTSIVSKMNFACCSKPEGGYETDSGGGSEMGTYTSLN
ncbi:hypothetical protein POTOM_039903 [Populus tomentosa]|uniref:Uncharacterized protein n=1 Tax=Populus tomentosa TaxID=118781 RepID=A0A8X8CJX5_POPTO|nr:hypothetical protein POTOM_039903 [Populus tomentosa]